LNPYEILYQDEDILVANKLAPLPVLRDKSGDEDLQDMKKVQNIPIIKPADFWKFEEDFKAKA